MTILIVSKTAYNHICLVEGIRNAHVTSPKVRNSSSRDHVTAQDSNQKISTMDQTAEMQPAAAMDHGNVAES